MHFSVSRSFNPLVLAEGEQYVTDYAVALNGQKGRLRVGTKSAVFEPNDNSQDLLRIMFRDVAGLEFPSD